MAIATPKKKPSTGNKVLYVANPIKPNTSYKQIGLSPEEQKKNNPVTSKLVNKPANVEQTQKVEKIKTLNFGQNALKGTLSQSLYDSGGVENYIDLQQQKKIQTQPKKLETVKQTNGFGVGFTLETKSAGYKTTGMEEIARKIDVKNMNNPNYTPELRAEITQSIQKNPQWFIEDSSTVREADARNRARDAAYVARLNYVEPTILSFEGTDAKKKLSPDQAERYEQGKLNTKFAVERPNGKIAFLKNAKSAEKLNENQVTSYPKPEGFGKIPSSEKQNPIKYDELMPFTSIESFAKNTDESKSPSSGLWYERKFDKDQKNTKKKELSILQTSPLYDVDSGDPFLEAGKGVYKFVANDLIGFGVSALKGSTHMFGAKRPSNLDETIPDEILPFAPSTVSDKLVSGSIESASQFELVEIKEGALRGITYPAPTEKAGKTFQNVLSESAEQFLENPARNTPDILLGFLPIGYFGKSGKGSNIISSSAKKISEKTGTKVATELESNPYGAKMFSAEGMYTLPSKKAKNIASASYFERGSLGKNSIVGESLADTRGNKYLEKIESSGKVPTKDQIKAAEKMDRVDFEKAQKLRLANEPFPRSAGSISESEMSINLERITKGELKPEVLSLQKNIGRKFMTKISEEESEKLIQNKISIDDFAKDIYPKTLDKKSRSVSNIIDEYVSKKSSKSIFDNLYGGSTLDEFLKPKKMTNKEKAIYKYGKASESGIQDTSARGGNILTEVIIPSGKKGKSILDDAMPSNPKGKITKGAKKISDPDYTFPIVGAGAISAGYGASQLVPPKQQETPKKKRQKEQNNGSLVFKNDYVIGTQENLESKRFQKDRKNVIFDLIQTPDLEQTQPQITGQIPKYETIQSTYLEEDFPPYNPTIESPRQAPLLDQVPYRQRIGKGDFLFPPVNYNLFTNPISAEGGIEGDDKEFFRVFASAKEPFGSTELPLGEFVDSDYPIFEIKDRLSGKQIRKANKFGGLQNPLRPPKNIIDEDPFLNLFGFKENKSRKKRKEVSIFDMF